MAHNIVPSAADLKLFSFDNSYARLPDVFYARLAPTAVKQPSFLKVNHDLAGELGIDPQTLASADALAVLSGNAVAEGSEPLAMAYAGHQFGNFVPQLGDGRALLLGEVIDQQGVRRDIQLKGSGPTPYSRRGDGRAALGPVLREYLIGEAMHTLGTPTTRSLAAISTGEKVLRDDILPGALLVRVASSHIRIGTFQYFAARGDEASIERLIDYALERHEPDGLEADNKALALLAGVVKRQAALVAKWLGVGFIHGVMNTDNMTISGETIDYGPCAFMDRFDMKRVFSSIDQFGRYAYGAQPTIAQWNLARLAEALLPLIDTEETRAVELAEATLSQFGPAFQQAWLALMRRKIGITEPRDDDGELIETLLDALQSAGADMTNFFRQLSTLQEPEASDAALDAVAEDATALRPWLMRWRDRLSADAASIDHRRIMMDATNPAYIPRNHLVEAALVAAHEDDLAPFERLHTALKTPYADQQGFEDLKLPPGPDQQVYRTFCGT